MEERYQKIKEIVERELSCSAHNMEHVMRVYNLSQHLAEDDPNVDLDVLKTAALLHDIARVKEDKDNSGNVDHAILGSEMAEKIMRDLGYLDEKIENIKHCIISHRFRSGNEPKSKEARILFDADKLDVLGSIGIARAYMMAGQYNDKLYSDVNIDEYVKNNMVGGRHDGRVKDISKHTVNIEFETKFKHIPGRLFTEKAREIGSQRIQIMEQFFTRLKKEIDGEA